ncbi:heparinase II/III domain-containing protein [Defluviitalea phaphyphila]|uniref:heparinase II/III domain-containing protein n=1 Tax=Defluviitalea phaphyphila TaxID=1473580 RepID=UPI00073163FF|nr:heparinase II/III family protein [Defluviitalea phaphyphila]
MEYFDLDLLKENIEKNEKYKNMIETMKVEVEDFMKDFHDDPSKTSRWGHHYFCSKDGGLLIYNRKTPNIHVCEICGHEYKDNELLNGVWVYMYRNEAILTAWKSGVLYRVTEDNKYLRYIEKIVGYYADHYTEFVLHNKEGNEFESIEEMEWGCGRIMPQGLNESIVLIRIVNSLELVKDFISKDFLEKVHDKLFREAFKLLKPQVNKIHNIPFWLNNGIGVMGLFSNDKEMIDFAFEGEYNVRKQLQQGVTKDGFWYEGSIHYNFFTLEGATNLLLFSELYDFDFGKEKEIIKKMFISAYKYAFDNQQLPNPNDGWPNLNLKSYSYIYSVATKIFGIESEVGNLLKNILKSDYERGQFPLSRPYYYKNDISLEQLILIPEIDPSTAKPVEQVSINFETSNCGIIKQNGINVFYKYGHNGPSHAHPDKMNIEVVIGKYSLSRDLSNSGYGNKLCNEWHRMTPSHNTVVINGENHVSVEPGECLEFKPNILDAKVVDVYPGVDFRRRIELSNTGFMDKFYVYSKSENISDYFFHVEANLITDLVTESADLVFNKNGYQHISEVKKVINDKPSIKLDWKLGDMVITSDISLENKELFIAKSPDNPITGSRTTLIIREKASEILYELKWSIK